MERKLIFVLAVLIPAAIGFTATSLDKEPATATFYSNNTQTAEISLEVADTPEKRQQGLMNRKSLRKDHGMLFVWKNEATRYFWMKNTLIPLDMIFISSNGTVLNVKTAYPEPNTPDSELKRYGSNGEAMYVIEVNSGFAENNSIKKGSKVELNY